MRCNSFLSERAIRFGMVCELKRSLEGKISLWERRGDPEKTRKYRLELRKVEIGIRRIMDSVQGHLILN
ncbi:hypothetical protein GF382_01955 [Candidatus Falkowbacteria bacterium]|nr:hypothetical protein [Candidatus Falkowbacteria bacterium]